MPASSGSNLDIGCSASRPAGLHEAALVVSLGHDFADVMGARAARLALRTGSGKVRVTFVAGRLADGPGAGIAIKPSGVDTASAHAHSFWSAALTQ
jgi:hypothetical protein